MSHTIPAEPRRALDLLTVFGFGYVRPAPGTWGSLPPLLFAAFLLQFHWALEGHIWIYYLGLAACVLLFSLVCLTHGDHAEARFGRKDPSQVVADEAAGMALTLMLLPHVALVRTASGLFLFVLAFFAFRVMDIVKPWPANRIQRLPGGWGILVDDLIAAVYAAALIHLVVRLA